MRQANLLESTPGGLDRNVAGALLAIGRGRPRDRRFMPYVFLHAREGLVAAHTLIYTTMENAVSELTTLWLKSKARGDVQCSVNGIIVHPPHHRCSTKTTDNGTRRRTVVENRWRTQL